MRRIKNKMDKIIRESIGNLLLEEFGIIYGLEPLCQYILEQFFTIMLHECFKGNSYYEIEFEQPIYMEDIKNEISCKNWYGLDRLDKIILKTVVNSYNEASVNFEDDDDEHSTPIIVISINRGFTKRELYEKVSKFGEQKVFNIFVSTYKPSIMHELTHLIEIVRTGKDYKYPAYAYMDDDEYEDQQAMSQVRRASFAFSKTEMNARVTTIYYQILNDKNLINQIRMWNGKRGDLCKRLISLTSNFNWINDIKKYLFIVRRAAEKGDRPDVDFVKNFIKINKFAAFSGSKNLFKLRWNENDDGEVEDVSKVVWPLYDKMYKMYYTYLQKLYKAANLAIEEVINKR